jgi:uncharacterized protein (DUF952 family)
LSTLTALAFRAVVICGATPRLDSKPFERQVEHRAGEKVQEARGQMQLIFKICGRQEWQVAEEERIYRGSAVDARDGFIHFSTAEQLAETATRHFAGRDDLLLIGVDAAQLGAALRFEPSRGGALFPHLYGTLPLSAVRFVEALPLGRDGLHLLPPPERLSPS